MRSDFSDKPASLEIKHSGKGLVSWSTRGQLGVESKIKAGTGFQSHGGDQSELVNKFQRLVWEGRKMFLSMEDL